MKKELSRRERTTLLAFLCLITLFTYLSSVQLLQAAPFSGAPYCSVPPMPGAGVKPNLLLLIDNSASMYDLAYPNSGRHCSIGATGTDQPFPCFTDSECSPGQTCSVVDHAPYFCLDDSYYDGKSYSGYFDPLSIYSYYAASAAFVAGATLPAPPCSSGSCAASTNYLYVGMTGTAPNRTVSVFTASGNFLNWLSMSKLDVEKQVLTGGKYSTAGGIFLAEGRGCQGKRFIKIVSDAPQITFGVRGPIPAETDYLYRASYGGGTRIEIYDKQYNKDACMKAVQDALGHFATLNTDVSACVGAGYMYESDKTTPSKNKVFVDIMTDCYNNSPPTVIDTTVQNDCLARISGSIYGSNPLNVPKGAGDDFCSKGLNHLLAVHSDGAYSTGYLGNCFSPGSKGGKGTFSTPCAEDQAEDYCSGISNPALMDPPAGTSMSVPSFILDAGIYSVGAASGTYLAHVAAPAQPTGLIQEFSNDLNFGAMVFNDNGSGSECKHENVSKANGGVNIGEIPCTKRCLTGQFTGWECHQDTDCYPKPPVIAGSCQEVPPMDGGKIISAINSPLGDHSSGLIAAIDQVTASSWTPLAESFYEAIGYFANRTDLRLQSTDFTGPSPATFSCQKNNVLIVSDGSSTADRNPQVCSLVANAAQNWVNDVDNMPASAITTGTESSPPFQGSYNLDDLAWIARNKNIADFSKPIVSNKDYLSTYVVYSGIPCGAYNADGSCTTTDEGVPEKMMQLTAAKGGGKSVSVQNASDLENAFRGMLQQIAAGSGTDASILSTGGGNGAVFLQEQFYPTKSFDGGTTSASWIGEMQSLWYYIDPFLGGTTGAGSTIREDTDGDLKLNLKNDRVVQFNGNSASLFLDANGDGVSDDGVIETVSPDAVRSLWRAGLSLWQRPAADRIIYTQTNGTTLTSFASLGSDPNASQLLQAADAAEAQRIISYVTGEDAPQYRSRTLAIPGGSVPGVNVTATNVWKLGDIISSTAKVQGPAAIGSYQLPTPSGYNDQSYASFIGSNDYQKRGTVYVGANDGMLHAFNLGALKVAPNAEDPSWPVSQKATLTGPDLGKEQWAFIPRNALPYLTYLKEPGYRHLSYVDGGLTLVDASIGDLSGACTKATYWSCKKSVSVVKWKQQDPSQNNTLDPSVNTWRTVVIGGLGLGGASCDTGGNCVPTPTADPADSSKRLGYSSYFALDVSDPGNPSLLWEFSNPALGYSTTGPAIVRIGDPNLNGRWFAVFGSGPTGPLDSSTHRFLGQSSQELKFFVVDLRTGQLVATIPTGIQNAFAGSMSGAAIDADRWNGSYQDDAIYVGYSQAGTGGNWTGGVLRIFTGENQDPTQWKVSKVTDGIGPVTGSIARLQDRKNNNLWLYFGTGRYFYGQDDMSGQRALYGIKEPCYNYPVPGSANLNKLEPTCTVYQNPANLIDQTTTQHQLAAGDPGWFINLDPATSSSGAERLITTPSSTTSGAVFFPTFQPSTDPCLPGNSYLWGVQYDTGGAITNAALLGKILTPLSTGAQQETGLSGNLTAKGGRRSAPMTGRPGGVKIISNSGLRPLKKIIHIQER